MIIFKGNTLEFLETLIRDSQIKVGDLPKDINKEKITIKLIRPDWENVTISKGIFLTTTKVTTKHSELIFDAVYSYRLIWNDNTFNGENDTHSILELNFDIESKKLEIDTAAFILEFIFKENFEVALKDISSTDENFLNIKGIPEFSFEKWVVAFKNKGGVIR
jgi:hypothetical protein